VQDVLSLPLKVPALTSALEVPETVTTVVYKHVHRVPDWYVTEIDQLLDLQLAGTFGVIRVPVQHLDVALRHYHQCKAMQPHETSAVVMQPDRSGQHDMTG
jgi:hypothetical protein